MRATAGTAQCLFFVLRRAASRCGPVTFTLSRTGGRPMALRHRILTAPLRCDVKRPVPQTRAFECQFPKAGLLKKRGGGSLNFKGIFCVVRACPNESYSRARAAFDATFPPCRRRALLPSKAALAHFFRAATALGHRRRPFRLPLNCVGPPPGLQIQIYNTDVNI